MGWQRPCPAGVCDGGVKETTDNTDSTDKKQMDERNGNFKEARGSQTMRRLPRRRVLGVEYRFVRDPQGKRKIVNPKAKPAQWMVMEMEVVHRGKCMGERPGVDDFERAGATGAVRGDWGDCGGAGWLAGAAGPGEAGALHQLHAKYDGCPAAGIPAGTTGDADGMDAVAVEPAGADELWAVGAGKAVEGGFGAEMAGGCE